MLDDGGYPSKKELDFIRKYDARSKPLKSLVEYIQARWRWDEYFVVRKEKSDFKMVEKPGKKPKYFYHMAVEMHTGGWSGHEDMMAALKENKWFFFFYHTKWEQGGHFWFGIPMRSWGNGVKA